MGRMGWVDELEAELKAAGATVLRQTGGHRIWGLRGHTIAVPAHTVKDFKWHAIRSGVRRMLRAAAEGHHAAIG